MAELYFLCVMFLMALNLDLFDKVLDWMLNFRSEKKDFNNRNKVVKPW